MNGNAQASGDSCVAAILSAGGDVRHLSAAKALTELTNAFDRCADEDAPYGFIVQAAPAPSESLRGGGAWRLFLRAYNRFIAAVAEAPLDALTNAGAIRHLQSQTEVDVMAACHHGQRILIEAKSSASPEHHAFQAAKRDVYLLLTHRLTQELRSTKWHGLPEHMRLLVRVRMRHSSARRSVHLKLRHAKARVERAIADDKTLSWRKQFIKQVPCLTAPEVARASGHAALNTSATASRWASAGKIFGVRWGAVRYYPDFQFRNGAPRPVIAQVLNVLAKDPTGWDYAYFFATVNSYLDQKRPMDELDTDPEKVLRIAQRFAQPAGVF